MIDIFWPLRLLTFYSFVLMIRSSGPELPEQQYQPLIFVPKTLEFYVDWEKVPENSGPYAVACPSFKYNEDCFNKENALDHKALIVRSYIDGKNDPILCEESFRVAIVIHSKPGEKLIELGYEVYFNEKIFKPDLFKTFDFEKFRQVTQPPSKQSRVTDLVLKKIGARPNFPFIKMIVQDSEENNEFTDQKLGFVWISKAVIQYNFHTWSVNSLSYFITHNVRDLLLNCENYNLGNKFYEREETNKSNELYGSNKVNEPTDLKPIYNNREDIFGRVNLSKSVTNDCSKNYNCVKKYNLVRPYQFRGSAFSSVSCSDLTTIPIWHQNIEDLLNYSEMFLVAIAAATSSKLKIIPGVYQTLTLPIEGSNRFQEIYLDAANKRFPVPRIIYKIVKYQTHVCKEKSQLCWFDMVIVIHNEPNVTLKDRICQDKCTDWGWENIQFMRFHNNGALKSPNIYCCVLNSEMKKKLQYAKDDSKTGPLNLYAFPYFSPSIGKPDFKNRKDEFEAKMRVILSEIAFI